MAWDSEMVTLLRVMVNDLDTPYKFTDNRIKQVLLSAAQFVITDASGKFLFDFQSNIEELELTPDPTDRSGGTRDDDFITLTLLKAGCIIDSCLARDAARKGGVSIREYNTSIDTRGIFNAFLALLESEKSYCSQYYEALLIYLAGNSTVGKGVFGPFRLIYNAYSSTGFNASPNNELFNNQRR
jgi:hypothetical protein